MITSLRQKVNNRRNRRLREFPGSPKVASPSRWLVSERWEKFGDKKKRLILALVPIIMPNHLAVIWIISILEVNTNSIQERIQDQDNMIQMLLIVRWVQRLTKLSSRTDERPLRQSQIPMLDSTIHTKSLETSRKRWLGKVSTSLSQIPIHHLDITIPRVLIKWFVHNRHHSVKVPLGEVDKLSMKIQMPECTSHIRNLVIFHRIWLGKASINSSQIPILLLVFTIQVISKLNKRLLHLLSVRK